MGRRAGDVVAVYIGGEGRRLGSVRIAIACGPAIVWFRRIIVEIQDRGRVPSSSTCRRSTRSRWDAAPGPSSGDLAVVKGRTLRLTVPLDTMAQRLGPDQRLRVLAELEAEPYVPDRGPLVRAVQMRAEGVARQSMERVLVEGARLVRRTGTERIARQVLTDLRKYGVGRSIRR